MTIKLAKKPGEPSSAGIPAVVALHPGNILLTEFLEPQDLTTHQFADEIGVHIHLIDAVIRGNASVTPGLARLFGHYLQTSPHFWLGLQLDYDLDRQG